jgi:4-diphosphocytidyl-2-C-methyl-D-erythritol kinase
MNPTGPKWVAQTPAKINLFFEILGRRPDRYHEILSLICPISIYDTLELVPTPTGRIELRCRQARGMHRAETLPSDDRNLVVRALRLLQSRTGCRRGAEVRLLKRIPSQAGLGGGSSDAACALRLGCAAWDLSVPRETLHQMAGELGSDVPLFLHRAPVVCRGRGERIEPVGRMPLLPLVLVKPAKGLATADVYAAWREHDDGNCRELTPMLDAFRSRDAAAVGRHLFNRLEQVAETLWPEIREIRRAFALQDCLGFQMSGSGTSFYGICRHMRHARRVARRLRAMRLGQVLIASACH